MSPEPSMYTCGVVNSPNNIPANFGTWTVITSSTHLPSTYAETVRLNNTLAFGPKSTPGKSNGMSMITGVAPSSGMPIDRMRQIPSIPSTDDLVIWISIPGTRYWVFAVTYNVKVVNVELTSL